MQVCQRIVPYAVTTESPVAVEPCETSPVEWDMRGAIAELSLKLDVLLEKVSETTLARTRLPLRSGTYVHKGRPGLNLSIRDLPEK